MKELDRLLTQIRRIEEHREKGAEKEIREIYQKLLKELRHYLADEYSQYAEDDKLTYDILQKNGYYARFLEEIEMKINGITPETRRLIRSTVEQTYEFTYNGLIDCVGKAAKGMELGTLKACTPDVIKRAVENPISKLTLNDRLEKHRKEIIYDIKQNISVGLINGDRYSTMANRIKQSVEGDYKKAIRIARTETHRVREAGNQDAALSVDEVLKSSESGMCMIKTWRTMKDERVRPSGKGKNRNYNHRKMDGVSVPVDEEFTLPSGTKAVAPGQSGVAGEDINCRCYLLYDLQRQMEMNVNEKPPLRRKRTPEEIQKVNENALAITERYSTRKSKWSGQVIVDDEKCKQEKIVGRKEWSCDILLKSTASDKTVIHEHLHARSGSYMNRFTIIPHSNIEEASVELLAREICKTEGIAFVEVPKANVSALREINQITHIRESNLDFAVSLFGKDIKRRYKWLSNRADKHIMDHPDDAEKLELLLKQVRGVKE